MSSQRKVTPVNLKERIAALQQRTTSPTPNEHGKSAATPSPSGSLRAKIAKFEEKGGVPVPRGSFGLGAPPTRDDGVPRRKGELYGNRIPSVNKMTPASSVSSVLSVGSDDTFSSPTRKRCISTSALQNNRLSRSFSTNLALDDEGLQEELESSMSDSPTKRRASISNGATARPADFIEVSTESPSSIPSLSSASTDPLDKNELGGAADGGISLEPLSPTSSSDLQLEAERHSSPFIFDAIREEREDDVGVDIAEGLDLNERDAVVEESNEPARDTVYKFNSEKDDEDSLPGQGLEGVGDMPLGTTGVPMPQIATDISKAEDQPPEPIGQILDEEANEIPEVQEVVIVPKDVPKCNESDILSPSPFSPSPFTATVEAAQRAYHETQHYIRISPSTSSPGSPNDDQTPSATTQSSTSEPIEVEKEHLPSPPPIVVENVENDLDETIRFKPTINTSLPPSPGAFSSSDKDSPQSSDLPSTPSSTSLVSNPSSNETLKDLPPPQTPTIPIPSRRSRSPHPIFVPPPSQEQHYVEPVIEPKVGPKSFHAVVHGKKVLAKSPVDGPDTALLKGSSTVQVLTVKSKSAAGEPSTPGSPDLSLLVAQAVQLEQRLLGGDEEESAVPAQKSSTSGFLAASQPKQLPRQEALMASTSKEEIPPTPPPKSPHYNNGNSTASGIYQNSAIGRHVRNEHSSRGSWSSENHSSEDSQAVLTPPSPTFDLVTPPLADEHAFHEFGTSGERLERRSSSVSSGSIWTSPRKVKKSLSRSNTFMGRMLSRAGRSSSTLALPDDALSIHSRESDVTSANGRTSPSPSLGPKKLATIDDSSRPLSVISGSSASTSILSPGFDARIFDAFPSVPQTLPTHDLPPVPPPKSPELLPSRSSSNVLSAISRSLSSRTKSDKRKSVIPPSWHEEDGQRHR